MIRFNFLRYDFQKIVFSVALLTMFFGCQQRQSSQPSVKEADRISTEIESSKKILSITQHLDSLTILAENESLRLAKVLPDSMMAAFYQHVGMLFYSKSAYEQTTDYLIKSEHYYRKANQPVNAARMLSNQAVIQEIIGNYETAINMYLEAARFFSDKGDSLSLANVYTNIGVVYEEMGIAEKSLHYNKLGLNIRQNKYDTLATATNFNNIGVIYDELYNQKDSALKNYQAAAIIYQKFNAPLRLAYALNNMARIYIELQKSSLASNNLIRAYFLMDSLDNKKGKANVLRNKGEYYFSLLNNQKAIKSFSVSMNLFKEIGDKKSTMEVSELMSKVYLAGGNYAQASEYMELRNQIKDTLMSSESKSIIAEMETRFQVKEKNKAIEMFKLQDELNQKKIKYQVWFIVLLVTIFILILLVFYFNFKRNKLKQLHLRLELQNYLMQIREMKFAIKEGPSTINQKNGSPKFEEFDLTEREKEVLHLIAEGYKNTEIAEKLFVSENTIKSHIKNIYVKLDVKNRVEALKRVKILQ